MPLAAFAVVVLLPMWAYAQPETVQVWSSSEDMKQTLTQGPSIPLEPAGKLAEDAVIKLNPQKTYQSILGMGASFEHTTCFNLFKLGPERMTETIEKLVDPRKGIGMNLMRICIGTPDFTGEPWYSYDDMPEGQRDSKLEEFSVEKDRAYVLPVLKKVLEINPDLLFFASPWSPPGWMKSTGDMIGGHLLPQCYGVYAEYFVRFIQAYAAEGIPIYAVTPQNEPGVNTRDYPMSEWYPSCQWAVLEDPDTFGTVDHDAMGLLERDFIRDHLGPAFKKSGINAKIWCYDHNLNNLWYPRNILKDREAAQYVDGTGFHAYSGTPEQMGEFYKEFPEKSVYFTEGSAGGTGGAMKIMSYFRNGSRTYSSWVVMIDYDGLPNNGPFKTKSTCIQPRKDGSGVDYHFEYYTYGQFMKFIKRDAVRIASSEGDKLFGNVAFRNPDGNIVLVAVNRDRQPIHFFVQCGKKQFRAEMPPKSVATYVWR